MFVFLTILWPANTYLGPDDSFSEVSLFRCLRMAIISLQFLLNFARVFYRHERHMYSKYEKKWNDDTAINILLNDRRNEINAEKYNYVLNRNSHQLNWFIDIGDKPY